MRTLRAGRRGERRAGRGDPAKPVMTNISKVRNRLLRPARLRTTSGWLPAAALLFAGCLAQEDPNTFRIEGRAPSSPPRPVPGAYGYPPEAPVTGARTLREFAGRFTDRVVVLDVWANWCSRSRAEMPRIVRLQEELAAGGVQVISCNLDSPSEWSGRTVPFLQSINAGFPCVVVPRGAKPGLRNWLGSEWTYALPARFILDRRGEVVGRFFDEATVDQVVAEVERVVRGPRGATESARRTGAELRARLIDAATGESHLFPLFVANPPDAGALGRRIADAVADRVDGPTRRIMLLPFGLQRDLSLRSEFGERAAEAALARLRERGHLDLVEPPAAERAVSAAGLAVMGIEFDPAVVRHRLSTDYVVLGWANGQPDEEAVAVQDGPRGR